MSDITISTKNSNLKIESFTKLNLLNNDLELILSIPLLTGKKEEIKFQFDKKKQKYS